MAVVLPLFEMKEGMPMLDEWTLAATLLGVIVAVLALTLEVWQLMNSKKNGRSQSHKR